MDFLDDEISKEALRSYMDVRSKDDIRCIMDDRIYVQNIYSFDKLHPPKECRLLDIGAWRGDSIKWFMDSYGENYGIKVSVHFMFEDIVKGSVSYIEKYRPGWIINVGADCENRVFDLILSFKKLAVNYKVNLRFDFMMSTRLWLYVY